MEELKNKYRPKTFKTLAGNESLKKAILPKIEKDKLSRTLLFYGDSGCGKTTIGRIIARQYEIKGIDFHELDNGVYSGKNDVQDILSQVRTAPIESKYKMYLFDECHNLSKAAQDSLLKILEEPPAHVFFVFCTTEPGKLLETIRSRCKDYKVNPLKEVEALKWLAKIIKKEKAAVAESVVKKVVQIAEGRPRRMLTLLDKVVDIEEEIEAIKILSETMLEDDPKVFELVMSLAKGQGKQKSWKTCAKILDQLKEADVEGLRYSILGITNSMILKKGHTQWTAQLFNILDAFKDPFFYSKRAGASHACYKVLYGDDPLAEWDDDDDE